MKAALLLVAAALAGCIDVPELPELPSLPDLPGTGGGDHGFEPSLGNGSLEITLYEDYQCPHCKTWELDGPKERLLQNFSNDITIHVRPVAFIGEDSVKAGALSLCAHDQLGVEWAAFASDLFAVQGQPNSGWFTEDLAFALMENHTVDALRAGVCVSRDEVRGHLLNNTRDMGEAGVTGTPGFVIGGEYVNGLDEAAVHEAIRDALASADGPTVK